jgi:hypothetical protein
LARGFYAGGVGGSELGRRARARLPPWIAAFKQENLAQKREQDEKRKQVEQTAVWDQFTQTERRELELRKDGQLARLLGEPLPGELPATLQRLAAKDQSQAERGLVALTSGGKTLYKDIVDLCPEDMPARIAANRVAIDVAQGAQRSVARSIGGPALGAPHDYRAAPGASST